MSHHTVTDAQATHYLPIARSIAGRLKRHLSLDVDDMAQEAMLKAVALAGHNNSEPYIRQAMANGIVDYIRHEHVGRFIQWPTTPDGDPMDVADWRAVAMVTCPHCGGIIPNAVRHAMGEPTLQEREVWKLLSEPLTEKEMSGRLSICPKTVSVHIHNLYAKLGVRNRIAAIKLGVEQGVIEWGVKPGTDTATVTAPAPVTTATHEDNNARTTTD